MYRFFKYDCSCSCWSRKLKENLRYLNNGIAVIGKMWLEHANTMHHLCLNNILNLSWATETILFFFSIDSFVLLYRHWILQYFLWQLAILLCWFSLGYQNRKSTKNSMKTRYFILSLLLHLKLFVLFLIFFTIFNFLFLWLRCVLGAPPLFVSISKGDPERNHLLPSRKI